MKIILPLFGFVLLSFPMLTAVVFAQQPVLKVGKARIPWTWEKPFPEKTQDVILGTKILSKNSVPSNIIEDKEEMATYPKAVITENGLMFFDENMKETKNMRYSDMVPEGWQARAETSGRFIGVLKTEKNPSYQGLHATFEMMDSDGNRLWSIDISKVGYSMPYVSPDGSYIIATGDMTGGYCSYMPSLWDRNGMLRKVFPDSRYKNISPQIGRLAFDSTGDHFALSEQGMEYKNPFLILYDRSGSKLWERSIEDFRINNIALSQDGRYVVAVIYRVLKKKTGEKVIMAGKPRDKMKFIGVKYFAAMFNDKGQELWRNEIASANYAISYINEDTMIAIENCENSDNRYVFESRTGKRIK